MAWRNFVTVIGGLAIAWPLASYAQQPPQPAPPKRVGLLTLAPSDCPPSERWWIRRLAELGWSNGTIVFECVSTGDRLDEVPARAHELVSRRPDVVMAITSAFILALKRETTTIPIVMLATWEPVRMGLVASLAQPGGNVTGVGWYNYGPKQMQLLREIVPHLKRVAALGSPNPPPEVLKIAQEHVKEMESVLGIDWQPFISVDGNDYDEIFARIAAEHFDAVHIGADPFTVQHVSRFAGPALRHRIPTATGSSFMAKDGILLSYAQDWFWSVARASEYVDKILRGAKPSDLAVEEAPKVELVINLKTARALGLTVPPSLLARADEVIE
jgi:putative ABC transport system substrate-binding protein